MLQLLRPRPRWKVTTSSACRLPSSSSPDRGRPWMTMVDHGTTSHHSDPTETYSNRFHTCRDAKTSDSSASFPPVSEQVERAGFISCVLVSPVKIWLRWTNRSWGRQQGLIARNDKSTPLSKQPAFHGGIRIHNGSQGLLGALSRTLAASSIGSMKPNPFFSLNLMQWNTMGASWRFSQRSSTYCIKSYHLLFVWKSINFMRSRLSKTRHTSKVPLGCRAISLVHAREVLHPQPDWKQLLLQHLLVLCSQPSPCRLMTPRSQQVESLNC